jgi:hypothetical protein
MIEKELILRDLQEQLHNATDETVKTVLQGLIADILSDRYNVRVW